MGSWLDRLLGRNESDGTQGAATGKSSAPRTTTAPPPELLDRAAILEALQLKDELAAPLEVDAALKARCAALFEGTRPVPGSPPQLAMRILNMVSQPDADPGELAKLISLEPALTAAVLRVANSAALRTFGRIDSVRDAITRLGMREVARIGCALSAKSVFDPQRRAEQSLYGPIFLELFVHASTTALAGAALAQSLPKLKSKSDTIFLGGLLHDLGKSVGLRILATIVGGDPAQHALGPEETHALLDALHVDFGAALHREWSLPESSLQICCGHHASGAPEQPFYLETHAVRLTSAMSLLRSRPVSESRLAEIEESAKLLGVSKAKLTAFNEELTGFREMAQELGS